VRHVISIDMDGHLAVDGCGCCAHDFYTKPYANDMFGDDYLEESPTKLITPIVIEEARECLRKMLTKLDELEASL